MAMVFCRGCGKEIHETATACPHCGFVQTAQNESMWMSGVASVLALIEILNWININNWNRNMEVGLWMFAIVSLTLAAITLTKKRKGKIFAVVSIVISVLTMLILLGKPLT